MVWLGQCLLAPILALFSSKHLLYVFKHLPILTKCRTQDERDELRELLAFAQRTPLARFGDQYGWLVQSVVDALGYFGVALGGYFLQQYLQDKSSKKQ